MGYTGHISNSDLKRLEDEKEYIPQIKISKITDEGKAIGEITIKGRNAIVFYEAAKIVEDLESKGYCMESDLILDIARLLA